MQKLNELTRELEDVRTHLEIIYRLVSQSDEDMDLNYYMNVSLGREIETLNKILDDANSMLLSDYQKVN